ncbi:MAG TPA: AAA family ATPase [Acidimicrobiales bacterium]|nr:AAA family ATPase [Acidimicrobiales bacterium]
MTTGMHGRDDVLGEIGQALDAGARGRGRLLFVTGDAGMGKTAVAWEAVRLARERRMDVAWGACLDAELASPFGPWLEILGPQGATALTGAGAPPSTGTHPQEAEWRRFLAFHAVVEQLRSRAAPGGLLVVLEDLHWARTPSQLLLRYVAAHLAAAGPVVLLGTCREPEIDADAPLATLVTHVDRLALRGLDESAICDLVADVTGEPIGPPVAAELRRTTGGNPFFVTEVARLGIDRAVRLRELAVPSEIDAVLSRRLARLEEPTRDVLRAAAVLGEHFDAEVLAVVAGAGRDELFAALGRAGRSGVVERLDEAGRRWAFVHVLFQQVCASSLAPTVRTELHRRAAAALDDRRAGPSVVAYHLSQAGLPPHDPRPARADFAAGAAALDQLAWEDAAAHFERAAATAPPGPEDDELRAEALLGLGDARLRTGDGAGAGTAFAAAADLARRRGWFDVLARAALGFGAGFGGFEVRMLEQRQIDLLEQAAALLPADSPLRPWVLARLSVALSFMGSEGRRLALADEAVSLARRAGDGAALASALAARCDAVAGPDHVTERLGAGTEIVALARQAADRPLELLGRRLRLIALSEFGSAAAVADEIAAFERVATLHGDPLYRWYGPLWRGMRALSRGELADAERYADAARDVGRQGGSANALVLSEMLWFVLLVERRSPSVPDRFRQLAIRHPELLGPAGLPMFVWVLALVGEETEARRHLAEVRSAGIDRIPRDAEWLPVMTQLAEAALVLGDHTLAAELRKRLEPYARLCVVEGIGAAQRGSVARTLALLSAVLGDRDGTLAALEVARAVDEAIGPLLAAHVRRAGAQALRRLGDPADRARASAQAREAAAAYRALGLDVLAAEAEALLDDFPPRNTGYGPEVTGVLRWDGDVWALTWDGHTARVRHSKGLADLAVLVARPGVEVHVRELEPEVGPVPAPTGEPALDRRAAAEYRARLVDIEQDLAEADDAADLERAARLRSERDFLVAELAAAFGLGGRPRPGPGDVDERLRKAVRARIKDALRRLDSVHPSAAHHLRHSVRTGLWCAYRPERPTSWQVDPAGAIVRRERYRGRR